MTGTSAGARKGWETRRKNGSPKPQPKKQPKGRQGSTLAKLADRSSYGVYQVRKIYTGQLEASRAGHALLKRYADPKIKSTLTTWRNSAGWHVQLYFDADNARQRGLIG